MKQKLFLTALLVISLGTQGYSQFVQDVDGRPMFTKKYEMIEGTPYLSDDWIKGNVLLADKRAFRNVDLKYDVVEDQLMFKNKSGEVMYFSDPVNEFSIPTFKDGQLGNKLFRSGYPAVKGGSGTSFFQVIADGQTQFLKRSSRSIIETTPYGTATKVKTFKESSSYYIYKSASLIPVKKDKKSIIAALGSKAPELERYVSSNSLNLKEDDDVAKLVSYYNSLN